MKGCQISKAGVYYDLLLSTTPFGGEPSLRRRQLKRLLRYIVRGEGNGRALRLPACMITYWPHRFDNISSVLARDSFFEELSDITLLCKWRQTGYTERLLAGIHRQM